MVVFRVEKTHYQKRCRFRSVLPVPIVFERSNGIPQPAYLQRYTGQESTDFSTFLAQ